MFVKSLVLNEFIFFSNNEKCLINSPGRYDIGENIKIVYVMDRIIDVSRCNIGIVSIVNGLELLDLVLRANKPDIVILTNYKTKANLKNFISKNINQQLNELSKRGLIRIITKPDFSYINRVQHPPEFWIFCVEGDTLEYIMKGDRNYIF